MIIIINPILRFILKTSKNIHIYGPNDVEIPD